MFCFLSLISSSSMRLERRISRYMSKSSARFKPWIVSFSTWSATRRPPRRRDLVLEQVHYSGDTRSRKRRIASRRGNDPMEPSVPASRLVIPVEFQGPAGRIEGLWSDPGRGLPAAVIAHPHPAHGGSMHSKVVYTVYKVLNGAGHPTLRFNFRGVGMSEGRYSGGDGEVGDAAAAAAYARARTGVAALWLAGFSFGSWVGAKWAVQDDHLERFIALGMPVTVNIDGRTF